MCIRDSDISEPDLVIIPGTKNTINDLRVIKKNGLFNKIIELKNKGTMILGICGGYQMLGDNIMDTQGDVYKRQCLEIVLDMDLLLQKLLEF